MMIMRLKLKLESGPDGTGIASGRGVPELESDRHLLQSRVGGRLMIIPEPEPGAHLPISIQFRFAVKLRKICVTTVAACTSSALISAVGTDAEPWEGETSASCPCVAVAVFSAVPCLWPFAK